ncbi:hypothetical protein SVEN_4757, partial [Streptomyces venezuelae ATCC 10712]
LWYGAAAQGASPAKIRESLLWVVQGVGEVVRPGQRADAILPAGFTGGQGN